MVIFVSYHSRQCPGTLLEQNKDMLSVPFQLIRPHSSPTSQKCSTSLRQKKKKNFLPPPPPSCHLKLGKQVDCFLNLDSCSVLLEDPVLDSARPILFPIFSLFWPVLRMTNTIESVPSYKCLPLTFPPSYYSPICFPLWPYLLKIWSYCLFFY